ncbi:MAG: AMP-binding protein [Pirellulales bacterium]
MMKRLVWKWANLFSPSYRQFRRAMAIWSKAGPAEAAAGSAVRLHHYLVYCRTYSPYWRKRWPPEAEQFTPGEAEQVLALLPPLTKAQLREHRDEIRILPSLRRPSDGFPTIREQRTVKSGGSTGIPVEVFADRHFGDCNRATIDFFYELCHLAPGKQFFFIWGSPNELLDLKSNWKKRLSSRLRGMHALPAFRLTPEKILGIAHTIAKRRHIDSAICFASAAETLMEFAEHQGLRLRRLRRVFVGGGMLHDRLRERLQRHWADDVYNVYGSRDLGVMAHETPQHDGLVVPDWFNRVEVLDQHGRRVAPGDKGEVHVTALCNYSSALIRVAMGDTARWQPAPEGGSLPGPRLTELGGRIVEHLIGPGGVIIDPSAIIHLLGVVIAPAWLRKFQLIQRAESHFELLAEAWGELPDHQQREQLRARLQAELGNLVKSSVKIELSLVDEIPLLPSGKHQYCVKAF